uniref:Uncharacterized protein n=1 Tax=Marseillevirus LCMAC201 TaxID=2506605 RepID=A0A481YYL5_9VIRU|nr:MAG: hypothetical protein LCMAC201_04690 [Marseillevirus LCMAC201]
MIQVCGEDTQQCVQSSKCQIKPLEKCPRWGVIGCDYEKYCTKLTDECGNLPDRCLCNNIYKDCCKQDYQWGYSDGHIKNLGQNEYLYYYSIGGAISELTFKDLGSVKLIIQPEKTGYLYVTIPPFAGSNKNIYTYLTRSSQVDACQNLYCKNQTFRIKKVYSLILISTPDSKSVWAYKQATGEIVDNITNPTIKLTATQTIDQEGNNYGMSAVAVPYDTPKTDYDIWLYEKV